MRISPYSYSMPSALKPNNNKKKDCSFGTLYDKEWRGICQKGDGLRYGNGLIKNYTKLIRGIKVFKELPHYLHQTYPKGAPIYEYACSAGHEASSIVISLFNGFKPEEAKTFLPIKAFDCNPKVLKLAAKQKLLLEPWEKCAVNQFKNIKMEDFLIEPKIKIGKQKSYKMTDKLTDNIQFNFGDLFADLNEGKLSKEPCVLFFRNAWQFLTHKGAIELATLLFEKLPSKSTIIIGEMDIEERRANKILEHAGFKKMLDKKVIDPVNQKMQEKFRVIMEGEGLSTFCFKKP